MLTEEGLQAIRERATKGFNAIVEVAKDPHNFRMSIPAREDDTDRLLVKITDDIPHLCDEVERLRVLVTDCGLDPDLPIPPPKLHSFQQHIGTLEDSLSRLRTERDGRPKIVCLCGSTRFYEEFQRANFRETMLGNIVLSVGFYPHNPFWELNYQGHGEDVGITPEEKTALDELHKRKIDLADEILVLNVGGYIGDSTRSEIEYARAHGKPVRWLEPPHSGMEGEGD